MSLWRLLLLALFASSTHAGVVREMGDKHTTGLPYVAPDNAARCGSFLH
jgi:hypothetical protein